MEKFKETKQRLLSSACDVLHAVCKDGGSYVDCMCSGDTQFVIEIDNINLENCDQLLPKFHLRGINFLLEMGLLADHGVNSKKVIDGAKNLEVSCE